MDIPINDFILEEIPSEKKMLLEKHLSLILEANSRINFTRITTFKDAVLLHIEDSLTALPELSAAPGGSFVDLGTGAGYPGIPLSIMSGRNVRLVDSVSKKAGGLEKIINILGLEKQAQVYCGRIEQLAKDQWGMFSVATARALSSLPSILELAAPLLCMSGRLICYKARIDEVDNLDAITVEEKLGMKLISQRGFYLSDGQTMRNILVYEKVAQPEIKLPRKEGMAQKRPLLS